jgi:peptidoglycan/LPS O-acetylase OafA/YrhL
MRVLASPKISPQLNSTLRSQSPSIRSLNGIRAISVLLVSCSHSGFGEIVPGGLGVTIFFFLSGYLITTLMFDEHERNCRIDVLSFYARRMLRLMPPLLVTLAIAYGLVYFGFLPGLITLNGLAALLLYFANYYLLFFDPGSTIPAGTGALWSLAVEEHFYIFYPLALTLFLRHSLKAQTMGIVLVVLCILVLAWRIYLVQSGVVYPRTYMASDTRIDSIIYGCLLAICMNPIRHLPRSTKMSMFQWTIFVIGVGILLATLGFRDLAFRETFRYSFQGIALLSIFYYSIRFHDNYIFRHLNSSWISKIGVYSYSVYLVHDVIIASIQTNAPPSWRSPLVVFPVTLMLSIAYAAAIDSMVDSKFRKLRLRFHPGRRKNPAKERAD